MGFIHETQIERFEKALWTATRKLSPELTDHLSIPLTRQQFYMEGDTSPGYQAIFQALQLLNVKTQSFLPQ